IEGDMEYLAKITNEEKMPNSKLYKYGFEDIQIRKEDCFYNRETDQQTKTCQSFEPDLINTVKEFEKEKAFAKFVGKTSQVIKKLDYDFTRKKRFEQLPHEIAKLRKMGKSWEYIAKEFYH
ncbi:25370_t:CDS:2, partial [Dentiscutata erythropus]